MRGIVSEEMLYLINYEPSRWPSGNPETGYLHCDGSPTKTEVLNKRTQVEQGQYWQYCFGKRPAEELYDLKSDPDCLYNLASAPEYQNKKAVLQSLLTEKLTQQKDPRIVGDASVFDTYLYADLTSRNFYHRYRSGEKMNAGWVNPSDFEEDPLD